MNSISSVGSFINFCSTLESSQHVPIEQLQSLEKIRKNLKDEFLQLENGKETYSSLKIKLRLLKERHMALRITILAKKCWKKKEPLPKEICKKPFFSDLVHPKHEISKVERKLFWANVEKELIALFSKEDPSILSILEKIMLFHGTNSAILPFMKVECSLIPTGSLIKFKKIVPMCGELYRGIGSHGINDIFLSLETIRDLERSWNYAKNISNSFKCKQFENVEKFIQTSLNKLSKLNPLEDNHAWQKEILLLMQLKQYRPDAFYKCIQNYAKQIETIKKSISETYVRLEQLMLEALETPVEELRKSMLSSAEQKNFEERWQKKGIYLKKEWNTVKDPYTFEAFLELISYSTLIRNDLENHIDDAITQIIRMKLFGIEELINISYFPNTYYSLPVWKKLAAHPGLKEKLPAATWEKINKKSQELTTEFYVQSSAFKTFFMTKYRSLQTLMNLSLFTNDEYNLIVRCVLEIYIRQTVEKRLNNQLFPLKDTLAQLDHLLAPPSLYFSESELGLITNPFPLLLASTCHKPQSYLAKEEFSSRKIPFGKDGIDLIFVEKANLEQMQEWIKKHNLDEQITVAEITPILKACEKLPLYHAPSQIEPKQDFFSARSLSELNLVLNTYATSLYKKSYPNGQKRIYHGNPHGARTAFWAYILANRFHERDIQIEVSKELLLLFAYLHDSGREDDGPDRKSWEEASAGHGEEIAKKAYPTKTQEIPLLKEAVIGKDDKLSNKISEAKKIIHAADTLEIFRCLQKFDDFHSEELWLSGDFSKEEIAELVGHANTFISLTEDPQLKTWLEDCTSPFAGLFQILDYACSLNPQKFSWLAHQAASGIEAFCTQSENQLSQVERERIAILCKS